jgi:5-formyltetrahydrofolate cyclo-ligase
VASEDFRQTATVVPSLPFDLSKDSLRATALEARKAFVRTLDDGHKAILEQRLAEHLTSLCAHSSVVAGYSPMGSEISPMLAMEEARAVGRIVAFPAFSNPAGPFGFLQPKRRAPVVEPDLIFVPLIAVDARGTRLGRGKGHYDRALGHLKKSGAKLIGVGWSMQRIETVIPCDPWDIPLHGFASPDGYEDFS